MQLEGDQARAQAMLEDATAAQERLDQERARLGSAATDEAETAHAAEEARDNALWVANELEGQLNSLAERLAADEARAGALERNTTELGARLERLREQAGDVTRQREGLGAEHVPDARLIEIRSEAEAAEAALERVRAEANATEAALAQAQADEIAAREDPQQAEAARTKLEAEAAALTALLEPGDGGDWPPLVDRVSVEHGYEAALGAALGDDISVPAETAAPVHWATLPPYDPPPPLPQDAEPLNRLVQGPDALARRLSQIGLVADTASGARLQGELRPGQRLVTKDGALWRWDGFTVTADARTAAAKRLEQRNRLAELDEGAHRAAATASNARAGMARHAPPWRRLHWPSAPHARP